MHFHVYKYNHTEPLVSHVIKKQMVEIHVHLHVDVHVLQPSASHDLREVLCDCILRMYMYMYMYLYILYMHAHCTIISREAGVAIEKNMMMREIVAGIPLLFEAVIGVLRLTKE